MLKKLEHEAIEIIPAILFFAIAFSLIHFNEDLLLPANAPHYFGYGTAIISALIVGKFLIIMNAFSFVNAFPNKPLIYNITWKIFIYGIFSFLFRVSERYVEILIEKHSMADAANQISIELHTAIFWSGQIWLTTLFIVYAISSEFTRVLGKKKIHKLLFG